LTECIGTLGCWLFVIGTSLLTDFSEGDAAGHIGTGGRSHEIHWPVQPRYVRLLSF